MNTLVLSKKNIIAKQKINVLKEKTFWFLVIFTASTLAIVIFLAVNVAGLTVWKSNLLHENRTLVSEISIMESKVLFMSGEITTEAALERGFVSTKQSNFIKIKPDAPTVSALTTCSADI